MTTPKPPREFWLDIATPFGDPCDFISEKGPHEYPSATNIHVIEFSAYEQACKERDEERLVWQAHYGLQNEKINAAIKERDELKIMIERINTHIFPGEIDSIDSLRILIKERDEALAETRRLSECYEETKLNWSEALASAKDHEDEVVEK